MAVLLFGFFHPLIAFVEPAFVPEVPDSQAVGSSQLCRQGLACSLQVPDSIRKSRTLVNGY